MSSLLGLLGCETALIGPRDVEDDELRRGRKVCGDGICHPSEGCSRCPVDCGRCAADAAVVSSPDVGSFDAGPLTGADAGPLTGADAGGTPDATLAVDGGFAPDATPVDAGSGPAPGRWYVSRSGNNADGRTWATAWNELDQIGWSELSPGDVVEIAGGTYTRRLVPERGGSSSGRITLQRSTEPGRDGKVTFDFTNTPTPEYWSGLVPIRHAYLTIDGRDWDKFEMIADGSCLLIVDTNNDADLFQLRNAKLRGYANPENGGTTLCIFSGSMQMDHVWFGTQVGAEDHIKLVTSTHSSLIIEHSVFTPWISINGSHSDLIEQCWPGCEAGDLVFKHNLIWDSGPGGDNLAFTLDPHWASVDVSYNVFKDVSGLFQFSSRGTMRISNNVFYNVFSTIGGSGDFEAVNNVFVAPPDNTSIVWGDIPRFSLWGPGTYGFFSGDGTNLVGDPMFLDPTDILGPDGAPFTSDDGFNLRPGSSAIDRGTPTIDTHDLRGTAIVGAPDIGAYELP